MPAPSPPTSTAAVLCFGVSAFAAGFDGRHLTTNDWFDADYKDDPDFDPDALIAAHIP